MKFQTILKTFLFGTLVFGACASTTFAITYTPIDDPLATGSIGTDPIGISGSKIVGFYGDSADKVHGFLYDGSTYTTLDHPLGARGTYAYGISGGNIVGEYFDSSDKEHGFLYNGSTYTTLDDPLGTNGSTAFGISGSNIVGWYSDSSGGVHSYLYNGSTYTTIDHPLGTGTRAFGISGNNIVGQYYELSGGLFHAHGYLYNGSTYTTLDNPLGTGGTVPRGISGGNIVGGYGDAAGFSHGFLYDGSTYTTLDDPQAFYGSFIQTGITGIDGNQIVGNYFDDSISNVSHGFVATVPEPSSVVLAALGLLTLIVYGASRHKTVIKTFLLGARARFIASALLVATILIARSAWAVPTITNLGVFSGGNSSFANAISADGSTVTGSSNGSVGNRAFRWTAGGGLQNLGILDSSGPYSDGSALSADGSVVTGISAGSNNNNRAFRWTAATGMQSLGVLGTGSASVGNAISANGSVIAGESYTAGFSNPRAFRWTAATGLQSLGILPGGQGTDAFAISADGSVIAGVDSVNGFLRAFRWTAGGIQDIGDLPGSNSTEAIGLSPDGSVATGDSGDALGTIFQAFRWTSGGGMQDLGILAGGSISQGRAITADNSIIIGASASSIGDRAFLWTQSLGMVDLNEYLPLYGLNLTGWTLTQASGISADGSAITGYGSFNGATRSFLITGLSAPAVLRGDVNLDGHLTSADVVALMNALTDLSGYQAAHFPTSPDLMRDVVDIDGDGTINNADLQFLLTTLKSGGGSADIVPEPSSVVLAALGFLGLVIARRNRYPKAKSIRHVLQSNAAMQQGIPMQRLLWMVGAFGLGLVIVDATQAGSSDHHGNSGNNQSNNQGNNNQNNNNQNNNQNKHQDKQNEKHSDKQNKQQDKTTNSNPATGNASPGLTVGGLNLKKTESPLQKLNLDKKTDKSVAGQAATGTATHEGLIGSGTPLGGIISSAKNKHAAATKAVRTKPQAASAAPDQKYGRLEGGYRKQRASLPRLSSVRTGDKKIRCCQRRL